MILTYVVIGLVSMVLLVACAAARPAGERTRRGSAARRRRFVAQNPTHVNTHDIHCSLVRDGVTPDQARFITAKAAEGGIKPFTMWLWLEQHGAEALGIVVAADLTHRELLTHISDGTVPHLEELKLFASANGLKIAGPNAATRRATLVDCGSARRRRLPTIHEPGTWPGDAPAKQPTDSGRVRRNGRGGLAA